MVLTCDNWKREKYLDENEEDILHTEWCKAHSVMSALGGDHWPTEHPDHTTESHTARPQLFLPIIINSLITKQLR